MGFKDIFKKSFLENFGQGGLSQLSVLMTFVIAGLFALYVFCVYRATTRRSFYSKPFNIALVVVTMITCAIIMTIQSSVVVSLGMVGALSIVRFRTAIKDPMDLGFLYWAISNGIICGAGLPEIALALAVILTLAIILLNRVPVGRAPRVLMVSGSGYALEGPVMDAVRAYCPYASVKSRALSNGHTDLVIEVRLKKEGEGALLQKIAALDGVESSRLLAHDGEVTL